VKKIKIAKRGGALFALPAIVALFTITSFVIGGGGGGCSCDCGCG